MIKIKFFTLLRMELGINEVEIEAKNKMTIIEVLSKCEKIINKQFLHKLLQDGEIMNRSIILLNGRNIFHLNKLNTIVKDKDEISLFPPGGGG